MRSMTLFAASAVSAALLAGPALAQRDPGATGRPVGNVTISAKAAAAGVGYTWGDGVLRYRGHNYHFSVSGITVADVGFANITGHGRVYHLNRVADFSGTYAGLTGEATVGTGLGGQVLKNGNGVMIRIDQVTRGARLAGAADGITLTLTR